VIDTHVHLDADQYPDPSGAIKRARDAGVSAIVVPGVGPASNRSVIELGRKFRGVIFPALGFHPERFEHSEDDAREVLEMMSASAIRFAPSAKSGCLGTASGQAPPACWMRRR
jgi:TatD DNase family protein